MRKGETVRSSNGIYQYAYTDKFGKRQYIYANDLVALRQKEEELLRDRFDGIDSQTGATRGVRNALTPEQQRAFLEFMDGHPVYDHWKPIFTFLIGTGVRVGELSGLTWNDIDFDNLTMHVFTENLVTRKISVH